jgi:hypothetical protein
MLLNTLQKLYGKNKGENKLQYRKVGMLACSHHRIKTNKRSTPQNAVAMFLASAVMRDSPPEHLPF